MGDYHLFPQSRGSEGSKYSQLATGVCFTRQSSESCESILTVRVPSPELCHPDEINQIWTRVSQHSAYISNQPAASSRLGRISESASTTNASCQRGHQAQSLLPPALEYSYSTIPSDGVTCRLSSASTETFGDTSPVLTKRSATPDLLQKLSHNLEEISFTLSERKASYSTASSPGAFSTTASQHSYSTPRTSTSSQSTLSGDMDPNSSPEYRKQHLDVRAIPHNFNRSPSMRHNANTAGLDLPKTPSPVALVWAPNPQEVSHMDWDDDEQYGKLARMKKSIGGLRAAALRAKPESHVAVPNVGPKQIRQPSSPRSPAFGKLDRPGAPVETHLRPIAARSQTYPTPIFTYPGYPPAPPPPQAPLPPRPVARPTASADRIGQCLPPLPPCNPNKITPYPTLSPQTSTPPRSPSIESRQRTLSPSSHSPSTAPTTRRSRPSLPHSVQSDASTLVAGIKTRSSRGSTISTNNSDKQRRVSTTGSHRAPDPYSCTICGSTEDERISTSQHLVRHQLAPSTAASPRTSIVLPDSGVVCECCGTSQAIRTSSMNHLDHHRQHPQQHNPQKKLHSVRSVQRSRRVSSASAFSCVSSLSKTGKSSKKGAAGTSVVRLRQWFRWAATVAVLGRQGKKGRRRSVNAGCERPAMVEV